MNALTKATYIGFAADRNRKSEEERSPEGLEGKEEIPGTSGMPGVSPITSRN